VGLRLSSIPQYEQGGWLVSEQVMETFHMLPERSQEASPTCWRIWVLH
jgi:hypothetical protein